MTEYIDKKELLKKINNIVKNALGKQVSFSAAGLKFLVDSLPSVDAVEVVRCKDCKWYDTEMETCDYYRKTFPFYARLYKDQTDYCSKGDRGDKK